MGGGGSPGASEMAGSKKGKQGEGAEDEGQPKPRKPRRKATGLAPWNWPGRPGPGNRIILSMGFS
jgi:hypothetical protein